jgi:hypothetical protein
VVTDFGGFSASSFETSGARVSDDARRSRRITRVGDARAHA